METSNKATRTIVSNGGEVLVEVFKTLQVDGKSVEIFKRVAGATGIKGHSNEIKENTTGGLRSSNTF